MSELRWIWESLGPEVETKTEPCTKCGEDVNLRRAHITVGRHVEKVGIFGWIKTIQCEVEQRYHLGCGREEPT